ncbi:DUF3768 domain-containing protein [Methylocystis sp.]|uniref:DUF3768 domain-containing protein n=1 Tax=Methylocystis sp. TaxID=1911079 RepID=UPI0025F42319|nr:DUF3768 domain-containing protein [Methylocystis sp.]
MAKADQSQSTENYAARVRTLNDALRTTLAGGKIMLTRGVAALEAAVIHAITEALQSYDDINDDNDPYDEHDFGVLTVKGHKLFFKIDYYDLDLAFHSPDAADPNVTTRVLTIMLADEY